MLRKIGYLTLKTINKLKTSKPIKAKQHQMQNISTFNPTINQFFNKIKKQYFWITKKDMDYMNWRFCDPGAGNYQIITASNERKELLGYIVYKLYENKYPQGYIVDLLTLPDRNDIKTSLLDKALEYFDENQVNVVTSLTIKNGDDYKIYRNLGFLDTGRENIIFYILYGSDMNENALFKADPSLIHFTYSDTDWI
jgi:hypothetical protein